MVQNFHREICKRGVVCRFQRTLRTTRLPLSIFQKQVLGLQGEGCEYRLYRGNYGIRSRGLSRLLFINRRFLTARFECRSDGILACFYCFIDRNDPLFHMETWRVQEVNLAGKPKLQQWSDWMRELGSLKFRIAESTRRHWKPIAIVLILIATVLPSLVYAKPLNFDVYLSTGEMWSGYCCGSLAYRTNFYRRDTSKALASLLMVTNSSWLSPNEIYVNLYHVPKLDSVTLHFQSSSTLLGEVIWKDGGIVPLWDSSMGERPRVSMSQDRRSGVLSFQRVAHPDSGFAILLEFSFPNEIVLTLEIDLSDAWAFGVQYYHSRVSLEVTPNQFGQSR